MVGKWMKAGVGAMALSAMLLSASGASAADTASGVVNVTATIETRISITIDDTSAAFGTDIGPDGTIVGGEISAIVAPATAATSSSSDGSWFVWNPTGGNNVKVQSNAAWTGNVKATENAGTGASGDLTVGGGSLRWVATTAAPSTYAGAGSAGAAFAITPQTWQSGSTIGTKQYDEHYLLRVDWDDAIGTFTSTVTYSVGN